MPESQSMHASQEAISLPSSCFIWVPCNHALGTEVIAVIRRETYDGVIRQAEAFETRQQTPHAPVKRRYHALVIGYFLGCEFSELMTGHVPRHFDFCGFVEGEFLRIIAVAAFFGQVVPVRSRELCDKIVEDYPALKNTENRFIA